MRTLLTLVLIIAALALNAQTRRIAHRSHSGARTERYDSKEGTYGRVAPRKVSIHLESGKDTMVYPWDSLAHPYYPTYEDSMPRANFRPRDTQPKEDIREMGGLTGKLIVTGPQ